MNKLKQKLGVCKEIAAATIKEYLVYRSHMLVSVFVGPVYFIVMYFIWTAVYSGGAVDGGGTLKGIEYLQMIRYFGVVTLIGYIIWDSADWNLSMLIRTGKFLTFALRPVHHPFFALSQKIGHRLLAVFVEALPCAVIFTLLFKIDFTPSSIPWTALSIALASLIFFFVSYIIGIASFWVVESGGIRQFYYLLSGVFSGSFIPLVFFPKPLQILQFFLPFQYTSYIPAMVFIGKYNLGDIELSIPAVVGIQALALLILYLVSELLYNTAMKRFTAVGA
ncbi:MAG: ABC-2 family transporter protein [Treponema sp.]|nr:ABC-2 family transporter protein [Treponema sp.]